MSLDLVELVMEIEDTFGVVFTNEGAAAFRTVGDVYQFLLRNRALALEGVCLSGAVFYRARRALCQQFGFERRSVRPDSAVDELFPARRRRSHWNCFREAFAPFALPDLRRPAWLRYTLIACMAGLVLPGVLGMFLRPIQPWSGLLCAVGLLIAPAAYWLTLPFAVCIPDGCGIMRGLVRQTIGGDRDQAHAGLRHWSEREVWDQLCDIISANLGVERRLLKPETSFAEDLGCD